MKHLAFLAREPPWPFFIPNTFAHQQSEIHI